MMKAIYNQKKMPSGFSQQRKWRLGYKARKA
jgi:hypothetical protein